MTEPNALIAWLERLPVAERDQLARRYAAASENGGATILRPGGDVVAIPPLLTPELLEAQALAATERNAHALVVALSRLTAWLMSERGAELRGRLFRSFTPLEGEALERTWREAERLATVRVDYLVDDGGVARALEVNATIPAMQGYSDIVAAAFLREVCRQRSLDERLADRLLDESGRNTDQLLASLRAHHRRLLGGEPPAPPRIAIIAREGDAQIGELRYLAARWSLLGCPTRLATPADVRLDGARLTVAGAAPDLIYRHVFARRLDPGSDFARACLDPRAHCILNPIASHLEVKAMLGLLSRAASEDGAGLAEEIGLTGDERAEIAHSVPWTRVLLPGPATGPAGERMDDLVDTVAAEGARFVLKRSWDYGGRGVYLGIDHDDAAAARAAVSLGVERPHGWAELVRAAAVDERDAWVVQELVRANRQRHLVAGPAGATWKELYVDLSVYTNLGVDERPLGGVCRAAPGRVVNLLGGGGLAPLLRREVIEQLIQAR
jgi:hypothetical protein